MSKYEICEVSKYSLKDLNDFIAQNNIEPKDLIQYRTVFEQMKQCTKYIITYWKKN